MTQRELDRLLRKWQERLRLGDWKVKAYLVTGQKELGLNAIDRNARTSVVFVRDRSVSTIHDSIHETEFPSDEEEVLVHELIHLLPTFEVPDVDKDNEDDAQEFTINALAEALIRLDRGTPG